MKWIVLTIALVIVPYTFLTLHYRKPGPAYRPYQDAQERANVVRLLSAGYQRITLPAQRPADPARGTATAPTLVLTHSPALFDQLAGPRAPVVLAGHTHGGQFFPGPLFVGLFNPLAAGLGRFGNLQCDVSRGTGCWGPPFRVGSPPEITEITLARG